MLLTTASGGIQKSRQPTRYSCIGVRNCVHRYLSKVSAVGPCSTIIPVSHQITAAPARDVPEIEKSTAGRPLPPEGVGPEHTGAGGHRSVRTFWTLSLSFMSAMKVLATFSIVIVCARAAHIGTYTSTYQSPVHYSIQTPSYSNQAFVHAQVPVASASGAPAVYRTPFVNRNGVVSRNPDAVWNDPVEHIPFAPTPVPGSEFLIYGDPGYGAYRGNFGGVSLNSGLYGYKSKKSAKA